MIAEAMRILRLLMIGLLVVYWPSIALGTHLPAQYAQQQWMESAGDKLIHFASFLVLAFLLTWCVMYRQPSLRRTIMVLGIVLLYGMADELTQMLVPSRHADIHDWLADCYGTLAGLAVYFVSLHLLNLVMPARKTGWTPSSQPVGVISSGSRAFAEDREQRTTL
jgi:VanZ family protein